MGNVSSSTKQLPVIEVKGNKVVEAEIIFKSIDKTIEDWDINTENKDDIMKELEDRMYNNQA